MGETALVIAISVATAALAAMLVVRTVHVERRAGDGRLRSAPLVRSPLVRLLDIGSTTTMVVLAVAIVLRVFISER
jgi:hypothetical protein